MSRFLILGARGTLGSQLAQLHPNAICWDREDADVLDFPTLAQRIRTLGSLAGVLNCVAYNDVDGAESNSDAAFALNAAFPGRLAALCHAFGVPIVHYSTNYVFDGASTGDYGEDAAPNPLSVYGRSKLAGEEGVRAACPRHYIARTAVLFGAKGPSDLSKRSFVELMIHLASKRDAVQAVDDEINSVTYAPDLAAATGRLFDDAAPYGTYHLVNAGAASWYDLAAKIFEFTERKPALTRVPGSAFPRPARRPARAVLRNSKTRPLRHWTEAVAEFVQASAAPLP